MVISDRLLVGSLVEHEQSEIIKELKSDKKLKLGLWYAITTAPDHVNLLYIMSPRELNLKMYKKVPLRVLGIAGSKMEAMEMVSGFLQEAYEQCDIAEWKNYFEAY